MSETRLGLVLTADASAISGALRQTKAELEALGKSAGQAGASAKGGASGVSTMGEAAQEATQKTGLYRDAMGRLRDENGRFVKSGSEAARAMGGMGGEAEGATRGVGGLLAQMRALRGGVDGLSETLRGAATGLAGIWAVDKAKEFALSAVESARAYELIQNRMEFAAKSQALANEEMARAAKLADDLATSEAAVLDIRGRLLPLEKAGTISRQTSLSLTEGLINTTKAHGAAASALETVLYGLNQAMASPIVRAEEYGQVIEPLPQLAASLDRAIQQMTGNATASFRTMVNEGKVTRELFATALVRAMRDFEGAGAASADTIDGALTNLSNNWERFKRSLVDNDLAISALNALAEAMRRVAGVIASPEKIVDPLQARIDALRLDLVQAEQGAAAARANPNVGWHEGDIFAGAMRPLPTQAGLSADGGGIIAATARPARPAEELRRELAAALSRQADLALRAVDEAVLDARNAAAEAQRTTDLKTAGGLRDFTGQGEAQKRAEALKKLDDLERQARDLRAREAIEQDEFNEHLARIQEERAKIREAETRAAAPKRDQAAEAEAAKTAAADLLAAAQVKGEAARREAEIAVLSRQAAERSGYASDSDEYGRVLAAEAEKLRLEDQRKALEDARRKAEQDAAKVTADAARDAEKADRERAEAVKRLGDLATAAASAETTRGIAARAASEAARAGSAEEILGIEARAEAERRALAVAEAGRKAAESLPEAATPTQRQDARAQAEAAELAKQAAEADAERLRIAQSLLALKTGETQAAEAATRAQVAAGAAASATTLADLAAIEERAAASGRLAETERRAMEARLSLGVEATKTERDLAEAAARGLAAQEEAARLAGEELSRRREIVTLAERASEAAERGVLASRTAAAALGVQSRAEIARLQTQAEAEARAAETERAVKSAVLRLGPTASDPEKLEAERAVREEAAAKEQERLGGVLIAQAQILAGLRERGADAAQQAALAEAAAAEAMGASSRAEIGRLETAAAARQRALDLERSLRDLRAQFGPEADPAALQAAEAELRSEAASKEQARLGGVLIAQAQTLADLRERASEAAARGTIAERLRAGAAEAASSLELEAARKRAEAEARILERAEAIRQAREAMGAEAEPGRVSEAEALAAAAWDAAEAQRQGNEAVEKRAAALRFEQGLSERLADLEISRAAFLAADGPAEERRRAAETELAVQQKIREAKAAQIPYDETALRASIERAAAEAHALDLLQRQTAALEAGRIARERIAALSVARSQGPAALLAEERRQAGLEAGRSLGGDAAAIADAEATTRAQQHADALADLEDRLKGLQTPYSQALAEADRWREGALAGLDPMAEGYVEFAAEVERVTTRMYVDALQHSTDYFDGVKRGLADLKKENEDWASTSEDFVKGWASTSEDAFVGFVKTGKFELASLADFFLEQTARMAYQQALAPAANSIGGGIANFLGGLLGVSSGAGGSVGSTVLYSGGGLSNGGAHLWSEGGYTGAGGKYDPAGIVHRGEVVWSQDDVRSWGGARFVDAMRKSDPLAAAETILRGDGGARRLEGYAAGGIVDRPALFSAPLSPARLAALSGAAAQGSAATQSPSRSNPAMILHATFNIATPDVAGFQRSQGQIVASLNRMISTAGRHG